LRWLATSATTTATAANRPHLSGGCSLDRDVNTSNLPGEVLGPPVGTTLAKPAGGSLEIPAGGSLVSALAIPAGGSLVRGLPLILAGGYPPA